ncbi:hypothetical protein, partial [Nonomuraea guangzhouensis]
MSAGVAPPPVPRLAWRKALNLAPASERDGLGRVLAGGAGSGVGAVDVAAASVWPRRRLGRSPSAPGSADAGA